MALRVARGLFRLWIVASVLWISGVAATTSWRRLVYYQPVIVGEQPLGRLQSTTEICSTAKEAKQCSDMLTAAGKNPFDAYDLKWSDSGWNFPDNAEMVVAGLAWENIAARVGLALIPPAFALVIGSALVWAVRGFR
jgi:hypothetical protein